MKDKTNFVEENNYENQHVFQFQSTFKYGSLNIRKEVILN